MLLPTATSSYLAYMSASNYCILESHAQLVQNITVLLQYHSISPVALDYLSPNPSSFTASLPSDIPSHGSASVPTYTYRIYISDIPSTLPYSFNSNTSSGKPISDPPSDTSEYQSSESSIFSPILKVSIPHTLTRAT